MLHRLLAFALAALPACACAELGVNIYGLAYHFDRAQAREAGLDNELIAGLGLRYRLAREGMQWIFDAGAYRDSGRNTAVLAGAGALWHVAERWRVGAALAAFKSHSYNRGEAFVAPVPLVAYELRRATLNLTYVPRAPEVNDVATLAVWLTWWP